MPDTPNEWPMVTASTAHWSANWAPALPGDGDQHSGDRSVRYRETHLSVEVARAAAHARYRTYFTTAADPAARCNRLPLRDTGVTTVGIFAGPTLLAIDELGYLLLPAEGS